MSRERSLGPEGGDQRRWRRQLHLDWGRVGVAWGKGASFHFLFQPQGQAPRCPPTGGPSPGGRRGRRPSPGCPMEAVGEAGRDGWQAAPPEPRLITDTKLSPRLNRKPAGSSGSAARPAPPRARLPPCAPPSLRAPASPSARRLLPDSRRRGAGRKAVVARRREVGGHCVAALAVKGGPRSQLGAAAGSPGRKGCWRPAERAE